MLFFRGGNRWQRVIVLATPLLVLGLLILHRQTKIISPDLIVTDVNSTGRKSPPEGISAAEWQAADMEFAGVVDATFQCGAEEMPAYWRLLSWSEHQAGSEANQYDFCHATFNELTNRPNSWRGRPVQIDLQVCRIMECAAPKNNLGIQRLYEVWGWSDDSRGSLYVVVTPELPAGMVIGESVSARATIRGYFLKVQGYLAAGSAARSLPATAPLIIGRMSQREMPVAALANWNELWFGGAGLLLAGSFLLLLNQRSLFGHRTREQIRPLAAAKLDSWVDSLRADFVSLETTIHR